MRYSYRGYNVSFRRAGRTDGIPSSICRDARAIPLVGPATAAELLIQGRMFSAQEALESGIVARIAAPDCLQGLLDDVVSDILKSSRLASRSHKRQLHRLLADQGPVGKEERFAEYAFADTEEYRQGIRRFLQKRNVVGGSDGA